MASLLPQSHTVSARSRRSALAALAAIVAAISPTLNAAPPPLVVSCARGDDLQAAIDASPFGSEVIVEPGICRGHFVLRDGVGVSGTSMTDVILEPVDRFGAVVSLPDGAKTALQRVTIRGAGDDGSGRDGIGLEVGHRGLLRLQATKITDAGTGLWTYGNIVADGVQLVQNGEGFQATGQLTMRRSEISRNGPRGCAGGSLRGARLTMEDVVVSNNESGNYGGGLCLGGGSASLLRVTIAGNTAAAHGGGLLLSVGSEVDVRESAIVGNLAEDGGGIHFESAAILRVSNSTIAYNVAGYWSRDKLVGRGGAIFANLRAEVSLEFTTVANNTAGTGATFYGSADVRVFATIVDRGCAGSGRFASAGYFLLRSPGACRVISGFGDLIGVDPLLGPLTTSGATPFYPLQAKSPAIDRVPIKDCSSVKNDQRGLLRPIGAGCDIGSFERRPGDP
jgi:hypothetical protein